MLKRTVFYLAVLMILLASLCWSFAWTTFGAEPGQVVRLTQIEFRPNRIQTKVGDAVKFINEDKFDHDVYIVRTANRNDIMFETTTIPSGKSIIVTINEEGLYTVYCTIHGGMSALLTTTGSFELTEEEKKRAAEKKVIPPIVKTGEALFWGKGQCHRCHRIGDRKTQTILRGPDLQDIGFRSRFSAQKLALDSGTDYLIQSIQEPPAHIVEGYTNDMAMVFQPPISLNEEEITAVITYLQSQGGEVDTWSMNLDETILNRPLPKNPFRNGNAERGKKLFESENVGCGKCHTVGDKKSISIGPDLTGIGAYRNWTWLVESIIDPNAEIGGAWKNAIVKLKSGKMAVGVLRENSDTQVKLLIDHDQYQTFPKDKVKRVKMDKQSRMPGDFPEILSVRQLADIIQYLLTSKD